MSKVPGGVSNKIHFSPVLRAKVEKKDAPKISNQASVTKNAKADSKTVLTDKSESAQDAFFKHLWQSQPKAVSKPVGNIAKDEVKVTYVPLDKRHEGVSKYDVLPHFSNRPKGFPDRYRAVNPKLAAEGVKGKKALLFPLKPGTVKLVDGNGKERGVVRRSSVKLNYAQVKTIDGEKYYYAFSTRIGKDKNAPNTYPASGWIKASAIKAGNDPQYKNSDIRKSRAQPVNEVHGKHADYQQYTVKNVAPKELTGADGKPKYGYMENGKFVSYKVLPGKTKDTNFAASDYLRRKGSVINLGFNAAGLSNDTFKTNGTEPLVFHRAPTSVKSATVDIDLYHPKDSKHAGEKPIQKMRFVYGYVESEGVKRWGWMALGALKKS